MGIILQNVGITNYNSKFQLLIDNYGIMKIKYVLSLSLLCAMLTSYVADTKPVSAYISYDDDVLRGHIRLKLVNNSDQNLFIPNFCGFFKLTKDGVDFTDEYYNAPASDTTILGQVAIDLYPRDQRQHMREISRLQNLLTREQLKRAGIVPSSLSYKRMESLYSDLSFFYLHTIIPARDSMIAYMPIQDLFGSNGKPGANYKIWFDFSQEPNAQKEKVYKYNGKISVTFWPLEQIDNYKAYFGDITCADTIYLNR